MQRGAILNRVGWALAQQECGCDKIVVFVLGFMLGQGPTYKFVYARIEPYADNHLK